jgi:acyl carrier protein
MNVEATIIRILVNDIFVDVPQSQIGPDDSLREILGLDSLGFTELRTQCEYAFGVTISDEDFAPGNFASVRTLAHLVTRLREPLPDEASSR